MKQYNDNLERIERHVSHLNSKDKARNIQFFFIYCQKAALSFSTTLLSQYSLWPAFKRGHGEQSQHPHQHVVKVKVTVLPNPLLHHRVVHVSVFIHHERPSENMHTHPFNICEHTLRIHGQQSVYKGNCYETREGGQQFQKEKAQKIRQLINK